MANIIDHMQAELDTLTARIACEKEASGTVTEETAFRWWNIATALRDLREAHAVLQVMH